MDVRIPKDSSLMVEGHHFGPADERKQEDRPTWEQKDLSSPSTISLDSVHSSITSRTKGLFSSRCLFIYIVWQPYGKATTFTTWRAKNFGLLIFVHFLSNFVQSDETARVNLRPRKTTETTSVKMIVLLYPQGLRDTTSIKQHKCYQAVTISSNVSTRVRFLRKLRVLGLVQNFKLYLVNISDAYNLGRFYSRTLSRVPKGLFKSSSMSKRIC